MKIVRDEARILMAARVGEQSGFTLSRRARMGVGTLYPTLERLERDGLLESWWGEIPFGSSYKPRIYRITDFGHSVLRHWMNAAMERINQLEGTFWGRIRLKFEARVWPLPEVEESQK